MRLFVVATSLLTVNTFNDVGGVVWTQRADDTKLWMPPAWKNRLNRTRAQEAAQRAQLPRVLRAVQHQLRRLLCHLRVGGYRHCPSSNSTELVTRDDGCGGGENSTVELVDLYEEEVSTHTHWTLTLLLAAALALALSRSAAGRRLLAAWAKRGSEREAALAESLRVVQRQLELLESQNLESEAEIERCRGLQQARGALRAAPPDVAARRVGGSAPRSPRAEAGELLSLLLDVQLEAGAGLRPLARAVLEAFGCCEAMMRDLAAGEEAAAACAPAPPPRPSVRAGARRRAPPVAVARRHRGRIAAAGRARRPRRRVRAPRQRRRRRRRGRGPEEAAQSQPRSAPPHPPRRRAPASEFGLSQECAGRPPRASRPPKLVLHATRRRLRRAAKSGRQHVGAWHLRRGGAPCA